MVHELEFYFIFYFILLQILNGHGLCVAPFTELSQDITQELDRNCTRICIGAFRWFVISKNNLTWPSF